MFSLPSTEVQTERFRQSLYVVPVRNAGAKELPRTSPDSVEVVVTLRYGPVANVFRRLLKAHTTKSFVLSGVGREVYDDIDGERNFEGLIDLFAARHKLTFFESRALLAQYYQTLTKKGIIVATVPRHHK